MHRIVAKKVAQKPSKQITGTFCSRRILYSRWRWLRQQNLLASVSKHLPKRSQGSRLRPHQLSGTEAHRSSIRSRAPLRWPFLDEVKGEYHDHQRGSHEGEDLTSGGVVGELPFSFEGRFDRQGSRLCNVHNLEATLTVQHLGQ